MPSYLKPANRSMRSLNEVCNFVLCTLSFQLTKDTPVRRSILLHRGNRGVPPHQRYPLLIEVCLEPKCNSKRLHCEYVIH